MPLLDPATVRRLSAKFCTVRPSDPDLALYKLRREQMNASAKRIRDKRRALGLCIQCGQPANPAPGRTTCDWCKSNAKRARRACAAV